MQKCRTTYRGSDDVDGYWDAPKSVTATEKQAAVAYLKAVREACPAPSPEWLKGRVATLLSHYYAATAHEGINAMVAHDWLESLAVLPQSAIAEACATWRDNETRKPTPAQIRKLAIRAFGEAEWERLMRLKAIAACPVSDTLAPAAKPGEKWEKPTEEQKRRVKEIVAGMYKSQRGEHV